jgi:CRISPR-associated protein Csd1
VILQALAALAEREGLVDDPDFEFRPVAWVVRIRPDGSLIHIEGTHQPPLRPGAKAQPRTYAIPRRPTGRSGTKAPAAFLVDNAQYVFGLPTPDKPGESADKLKAPAARFRAFVEGCAAHTGDEGVNAVLKFLDAVAAGALVPEFPADAKSNDLFAFLLGSGTEFVHEGESVRAYWRAARRVVEGAGAPRPCLVTGRPVTAAPLVPLIRRVPGGSTSGVGLVSFNQSAFCSHGWEGNANAVVSREAAEAVATALNRLLDPRPMDPRHPGQTLKTRHLRLSADSAVVFWSGADDADAFVDFLSDTLSLRDPEQVPEMYRSIWRGRSAQVTDASAFYAMTLSGSQGRLIVRDWMEATVADVAANLARHFDDIAVVRNARWAEGAPPAYGIRELLEALAPGGRADDIPSPAVSGLVHAALHGSPYPTALLQRALLRARAEIGGDKWIDAARRDARAAIIKAVLRRSFGQRIGEAMDPTNVQPGYLLGRLMAVIERMQVAALGDVNASVVDRYFAGASANPASVFPRLVRGLRNHARKAKDDEQSGGTARWLEREVDAILSQFQGAFPPFLDLTQQGLFVIGYHQERHHLWKPRAAARSTGEPTAADA